MKNKTLTGFFALMLALILVLCGCAEIELPDTSQSKEEISGTDSKTESAADSKGTTIDYKRKKSYSNIS